MRSTRLNHEESRLHLYREKYIKDDEGGQPSGKISFFRVFLENGDLSALTLTGVVILRCEVKKISFENSDLSEASMCWNDFIDVNFAACCLFGADMRASVFTDVSFLGADLRGADLRHSGFEGCKFDGALMERAKITFDQGVSIELTAQQRKGIHWSEDSGLEPAGG